MTTATLDPVQTIHELGMNFARRAGAHDEADRFVAENYEELRAAKIFSAMVPSELGGGGISHREMCGLIRTVAGYCGSTALALSMHQHLVAAAVWNYLKGNPGEKLLRRVTEFEAVLASTGANDWLTSSGTLTRCQGGFRLTGKKIFVSGAPAADLLITSAQYDDPDAGWQVLHFPLPTRAAGVKVEEVWKAMGMRGTGSQNVVAENVFIPEESVGLRRPRGRYHPVWNVVCGVALPLICSAYVGVAEAAAQLAIDSASKRADDGIIPLLIGEMQNELTTAQIALESMVALTNNFDFEADLSLANAMLVRKTIVAQAVLKTSEKALELTGGSGYFRIKGLERLVRDAHAGQFHPLPAKQQQRFTGRYQMGLEPIEA